jgi:phosphoribosylcarboxyaminoimidazole (NCAIR) mutase
MPGGVPVASMAIGKAGAKNAAIFALAILALSDTKIKAKIVKYKQQMRRKIKQIRINL